MSEILKELDCSNISASRQTLVKYKDGFFVVSTSYAYGMDETYVFPGDENGVAGWTEVWATRPADHEEGIEAVLNGDCV